MQRRRIASSFSSSSRSKSPRWILRAISAVSDSPFACLDLLLSDASGMPGMLSPASVAATLWAALRDQMARFASRKEGESRTFAPANHWVSRQEGSLDQGGWDLADHPLECRPLV